MKSRIILFIGLTMLITLSFTLVSINSEESRAADRAVPTTVKASDSEPVGGFVSEDRF